MVFPLLRRTSGPRAVVYDLMLEYILDDNNYSTEEAIDKYLSVFSGNTEIFFFDERGKIKVKENLLILDCRARSHSCVTPVLCARL